MTKKELTALAMRVLAVWLFAEFATTLSMIATGLIAIVAAGGRQTTDSLVVGVMAAIPAFVYLILAAILWTKADRIADYACSEAIEKSGGTKVNCSSQSVLEIAFATTGVYIFVTAIPPMFRRLAGLFAAQVPIKEIWQDSHWQIEFWAVVLQLILGLWLAVGTRGIARTVRMLQRRDVETDNPSEMPSL